MGRPAAEAIVAERERNGPFRDLFELCARIDRRAVNRRVLEALVRAGALDTLPGHAGRDRAQLLATVGLALEAAEQAQANVLQAGLFDDLPQAEAMQPAFAAVRPWTERERLKEEKSALGFFLSGHPFHAWAEEVRRLVSRPLASLEPGWDPVWIAGVVTALRTKMGNRGKMAFVEFDDGTAQVEVLAYSEVYEAWRYAIVLDEPLFAEVKVSPDDYSGGLRVVAERFATLAQLREERARAVALTVALERTTPEFTAELEAALRPHLGGKLPLALTLRLDGTEGMLRPSPTWGVHPQETLLAALRAIPGVERVEVRYA